MFNTSLGRAETEVLLKQVQYYFKVVKHEKCISKLKKCIIIRVRNQ